MNERKTYKRKRSYSKGKRPQKRYKSYPTTKKKEDLLGKATFQKQLIIDDRQMIKLRYVDTSSMVLTIPTGGSVSNTNQYALNGLYDVNAAYASTSVPGFSEWGTFYRHYRVKAAYIECTVLSNNVNAACGVLMHAQPSDAAVTIFNNYVTIREFESNPYTKKVHIGSLDGGAARQTMSMYVDLKKLNGNQLQWETNPNTQSNFTTTISTGANPQAISNLYVLAYALDGLAAGSAYSPAVLDLSITFYVECSNRLDVTT